MSVTKSIAMKADANEREHAAMTLRRTFEALSEHANRAMGSPIAFALATLSIILWAASGPIFHFSDLWQLTINTGTTIITFLLGFIIANAQNHSATRDHAAMEAIDRLEREHGQQLSDLNHINRQQTALLCVLLTLPLAIVAVILWRRRLWRLLP